MMHLTKEIRCTRPHHAGARDKVQDCLFLKDIAIVLEIDIFIMHLKQFGKREQKTQILVNNFCYSINFSTLNELFFVLYNY